MITHVQKLASAVALVLACAAIAGAQDKEKTPPQEKEQTAPPSAMKRSMVPLRIDVVLSRYQGEKKISSLPFTLSVNANADKFAQVRMGARIPVSTMSSTAVIGPITYQDIGTSIDCRASSAADNRFHVDITIEDTSVYPNDADAALKSGNHSFRSFRSMNALLLRDGQSAQFAAAADRITGEVVRVDVTLAVVK